MEDRWERGVAAHGFTDPAMGGGLTDDAARAVDDLVGVKLWENPCWFSFRLNYLALGFNIPVYSWTEKHHGLARPEFVVLYSIGLKGGIAARDICSSSGFPRNTISRAVQKLLDKGIILREVAPDDQRSFVLHLTQKGRKIFDDTLLPMVEREQVLLARLTQAERLMLSELLAKMVVDSKNWPTSIDPEE
ncbi:MarR family winged helix-turn-helix transcriptional regulator [Nitratireductor soli]|uniref:MarR family winged helix-turn-helix transcriptional regulator n=1 Tax=Nitratireductor soli TaxID=1670619 RepID=UPI000ADF4787|nr:MarR family transcriptional regulator [Nitratireductor soli]